MDISRNQESMSDSEICVNWLSAWERRRLIWNLRNSALQDFGKTIKTSFPKIVLSLLEFRLQKRCLSSQIDLLNTQSTMIFGDATFSRLVSPFLSWTVNCVFWQWIVFWHFSLWRHISLFNVLSLRQRFARSHFPLSKKTNKTYLHSSSHFTLCSSYLLAYKWMAS